jgi:hypothetical protein
MWLRAYASFRHQFVPVMNLRGVHGFHRQLKSFQNLFFPHAASLDQFPLKMIRVFVASKIWPFLKAIYARSAFPRLLQRSVKSVSAPANR